MSESSICCVLIQRCVRKQRKRCRFIPTSLMWSSLFFNKPLRQLCNVSALQEKFSRLPEGHSELLFGCCLHLFARWCLNCSSYWRCLTDRDKCHYKRRSDPIHSTRLAIHTVLCGLDYYSLRETPELTVHSLFLLWSSRVCSVQVSVGCAAHREPSETQRPTVTANIDLWVWKQQICPRVQTSARVHIKRVPEERFHLWYFNH